VRLHAPVPVRARGIARLRMLLSDGTGPLYRPGRGSLGAALLGVLAALQLHQQHGRAGDAARTEIGQRPISL